jgi:chromosome segregation ATPase
MSEDPTQKLPAPQNGALEQILAAVRSLESRLESLESKVEERLYDTRPIWEKVEADIAQLKEGQQRLDERIEALRDETRTGFRNLKRQFGVLYETFIEVQADYKDLDKRLYRFEEPLEEKHT